MLTYALLWFHYNKWLFVSNVFFQLILLVGVLDADDCWSYSTRLVIKVALTDIHNFFILINVCFVVDIYKLLQLLLVCYLFHLRREHSWSNLIIAAYFHISIWTLLAYLILPSCSLRSFAHSRRLRREHNWLAPVNRVLS